MSPAPTPAPETTPAHIALRVEIANADPRSQIMLRIEPAAGGSVAFAADPAAAWQPASGEVVPEFIAIDPAEVLVSIGRRRSQGELNLSLPLEIAADPAVRSVVVRVSAAPCTRLAAAVGDAEPIPLDDGTTLSW